MGKHIRSFALIAFISAGITLSAGAAMAQDKWVGGGFEMSGYLSVGAGWQRFSNAPVTEISHDGTFAGVLGAVIPNVQTGVVPSPKQDNAEAFLEVLELDINKKFGTNVKWETTKSIPKGDKICLRRFWVE